MFHFRIFTIEEKNLSLALSKFSLEELTENFNSISRGCYLLFEKHIIDEYSFNSEYPILLEKKDCDIQTLPINDAEILDYYYRKDYSNKGGFKKNLIIGMTEHSGVSTCFIGSSVVETEEGPKMVENLQIGDKVRNFFGSFSRIIGILTTQIDDIFNMMIHKRTGLTITKYHPVLCDGKWVFPAECEDFEQNFIQVTKIYSLALESEHIAIVDNIPVICLGHNFEDGILKHEYFGTNKVIEDINKLGTNGVLNITQDRLVVRNKLIVGIS